MSYLPEANHIMPNTIASSRRVLIVEDEFITNNTLELMLHKAGYTICGNAFSVAEALAILETESPEMVLVDIYLQGELTGIDLAKILDEKGIPFIFISAYSNASLIEEAKETRPYGYIVKPFREQDILVTVEIAFYRFENGKELALQKEHNLLLRLSKELTEVNQISGLFTVLHHEMQQSFPLDEINLTLYSQESDLATRFTWNKQLLSPVKEQNVPFDTQEKRFYLWLEKQYTVVSLNSGEWYNLFQDTVNSAPKKNLVPVEIIIIPLRQSGHLIGSLTLNISTKENKIQFRKEVFQTIGDQVTSLITNIHSREEKAKREQADIFLDKMVQTLSEANDWEQKLFKLAKVIQQHIPFDFIVLGLNQEKSFNPIRAFYRIGFEEYQVIQVVDMLSMLGINSEQYESLLTEMAYQKPAIWEGEEFEKVRKLYRLKGLLAKKFQVNSNLTMPLPMARGGTFEISLYSRKDIIYTPEQFALLDKLRPSLILTLDRLFALGELEMLSQRLGQGLNPLPSPKIDKTSFEGIIGKSAQINKAFELTAQVAPVNTTVLIQGESGTGKELFAKAIHQLSPRKDKPLIKINCAAIPGNLIESELFGHEKGAFTGALEKRIGKFELAQGGTIFLDEIGEMPLDLQVKLLRVLQEREIERIGGKSPIKIDVRIIAATNRTLKEEVAEGKFRLDLYYRLHVFPLSLPSLRERPEDIPMLADYFAKKFCKRMGRTYEGISESSMAELQQYSWPGNIRELENFIERAVIMHIGTGYLEWTGQLTLDEVRSALPETSDYSSKPRTQQDVKLLLQESEREQIIAVLLQTGGRIRGKNGAAELLNLKPTTLESRMEKLGIKK